MRGSMIFGASRAITRRNSELEDCKALVIDLTDVVHLGVSASLALEEAVLDMLNAGRAVYITGAKSQPLARLKALGIAQRLPPENLMTNRSAALERAFYEG
jgi:SulP family sulfate permease